MPSLSHLITDRALIALWVKRTVVALFLLTILSMQIFSVILSERLGAFHKNQLQHLSNIRTSATSAHILLENILAGKSAEPPVVVEDRLAWAIAQTRLLPLSCEAESLIHHHHPAGIKGAIQEITGQLDSLRRLGRQRLLAATDHSTTPSLTVRYDDTFSQLIDTSNALESGLWQSRDQDKAFLLEFQFGMILVSAVLAILTILVFHRYDVARKQAMKILAEKEARSQFISQFSRFCRDAASIEPVYEMITSWLAEHLQIDRVSVWMFRDEGATLECRSLHESAGKRFSQGQIVLESDFPGYFEAIKRGDVLIISEDAHEHPSLQSFAHKYLLPLDIRAFLNLPIKAGEHSIGLLALSVQGKTRRWEGSEINLCNIVADQLSIAFDRIAERELREKAQADHANQLEEEVRLRTEELETANKTLRENEARLQLTFNKGLFGAALVGLEGEIITANEEFCRMAGYSEEELRSHPFVDLLHPANRETCLKHLQQILANELEVSGADKKYLRKDGELFWGRTTIRLVRNENGVPLYFMPTVEDVSERKLYEEQLKRLYKAIEQSPLSIVITDPGGHIEYANPFFSTVTGYSMAEVVGKKPNALKSGVHSAEFYHDLWQTIANGKTWQGEICNRKKDGSLFWEHVVIAPVTDNDDTVASYIAVKEDISERKKLTDALRERTEVLTSIAAAALSAIIMMDSDGRITFWNKAAEQIFGWSRDEALGQDLHQLIAPAAYHQGFLKNFVPFKQNGEGAIIGAQVELSALRKDGSEFPAELSISPLQIKDKWHAVGLINDISARKEAEEAILLARDEAQAANRTKSDFLARMSHEIRTPMNAIIGLSHLAMELELSPKLRDYLVKISTSGKNLLHIINDILDFSKIEAEKLEIASHPFSLKNVLIDLAGLTTIKAQEKQLEFMFDVAPDVPDNLMGDAIRLGQVLLNLITNAIKFTDHGEIVLRITVADRAPDRLSLQFSVRDTGLGLTEEQLGRLFTPFSQADGSISRTHGGTGLGLAISKRLVELMGGAFQVESTPGHGSTFAFTAVLAESLEPVPSLLPHPDARNLRVLMVEDNPTSSAILQMMLQSFSFTVEVVASGEACLELLGRSGHENAFDLFLLDYRLPGIQGDQVARAIRLAEGLGVTAKILLITGAGSEEIAELCLDAGCDGVLHKPVNRLELFDAIMALYKQDHSTRAPGAEQKHDSMPPPFTGARVLLAEDNELNQQVAREILERAGITVDVADNGEIALELAKKNDYDLVLMDIQMPGMDGLEATRRIRASGVERLNRLPIVAMTAHAIKGDEEVSMAAGMNAHITKPIDQEILFSTLGKWLPSKGTPEAAAQTPGRVTEADTDAPDQTQALLKALLPDLEAHRPVQCGEHVARLNAITWPIHLHLEKNTLVKSIENYQFRQAMRLAEKILADLEGRG